MKKLNSYQKETLNDFNYLMCNFKLDLKDAENKIINTLKENKDNIKDYYFYIHDKNTLLVYSAKNKYVFNKDIELIDYVEFKNKKVS